MRIKASWSVKSEIEDDVHAGRLIPGDHLDEQMLAERFGVSRTPAREALIQLEAAGMVKLVPRRGAVILGVSVELGIGMFEALTALEAEAAGLAARRMTGEERAAISRVHQESRGFITGSDPARYIRGNEAFHDLIYKGARNAYLADQVRNTNQQLRVFRRQTLHRPSRLPLSWQEHGTILAAIKQGDEPSARDAMRVHMLAGGTVFADMVISSFDSSAATANTTIKGSRLKL